MISEICLTLKLLSSAQLYIVIYAQLTYIFQFCIITEVDTTTKSGLKPEYVASEIVKCVTRKVDELILAPFHVHLAICLRTLAPWLFFQIMASRAKKESSQYSKNS